MGQAKPTKTPRTVGAVPRTQRGAGECPPPRWKRVIKRFSEVLVFLLVLAVFAFSLYKILTISGVFQATALSDFLQSLPLKFSLFSI